MRISQRGLYARNAAAAILGHTTLADLVERNRRMVGARARRGGAR